MGKEPHRDLGTRRGLGKVMGLIGQKVRNSPLPEEQLITEQNFVASLVV